MNFGRRPILKIIVLGDSGVGKTSLLEQFVNNKFTAKYKATIGADFMTKDVEIDGKLVTLQIWDTAGLERFQSLGNQFYRGADGCILVFDVKIPKTFEDLETWRREFLLQGQISEEKNYPFILIGNKIDQKDERVITSGLAEKWCELKGNLQYVEASAKNNINVEKAFISSAEAALKFSPLHGSHNYISTNEIDINEKASGQTSCDC